MKASVIIPNLNGAGWLRDSIESIWAQTEQDFELIVIDNGSTDESLEIARSYCGRDRYTLIENAENTGFSHAVNQGIAIAKGEYMALFNNDAFAEPTWLAELLRTAEADPKIFAVSSLMLRFYEPELADDAGDYVTILGFACKRGDGLKASRYTKPCRIFSACGGAALYRKSILDKIGVFDELFFAYYEDVDLSWRANNFGYKNVYCPTARCRHICGATTGAVRYNPFKSIQSGRNSILLPYKNQPLLMMLLNLIPMVLGYLLKVVMFRFRGFGNDYAKGFHEAWVALPKLNKPKFHWKNLPNYIWVECSLIVGLFRYLHSNPVEKSTAILREVLDTLEEKLYRPTARPADMEKIEQYIDKKVDANLQKLRDARSLRELMAADTIWVNGVEYKNLHQLAWLFDRERLKTLFAADPVGTIHGDLTIENIICRLNPGANGGWYLIDPNTGNLHESPFLDYGKLLQSLHGSYEFMMKTPRVTVQGSRIDFALTRSAAYDALYRALMADLQSRYPAAQVESILMHEVIHWLRLMPYKLAKDRKRAPMFYAGLVMVANDVANFAKGENVC